MIFGGADRGVISPVPDMAEDDEVEELPGWFGKS